MTSTFNLVKILSITASSLILLTACSSSNDGDSSAPVSSAPGLAINGLTNSDATMLNPWLTSVNAFRFESNTPGSGDIRVATIQYNESRTVQDSIDWYSGNIQLDTCEIAEEETNSGGDSGGTSSVPYVSGGDNVVISSPEGTWFTLSEGDTGIYEVDNELPGVIPAGATISIPGLVFPAVGAIPISEPPAPVRITPAFGPISTESVYQWQASGGNGEYIRLSFIEFDSNGDFVGFPIGCDLEDDGEFSLPDNVLLAISNISNTLEVRYTRRIRSLSMVEGVMAFTRISVAE